VRALGVLLLVAATALLLWWWLVPPAPRAGARSVREEEDASPPERREAQDTGDGQRTEELTEAAPALLVRVLDAGDARPLAGVRVGWEDERAGPPLVTDEAGEARLPPPDGTAWVAARKVGYRWVDTEVTAADEVVELRLQPGVRVDGRVVHAEDGAPVAGVAVRVADRATGMPIDHVPATDAEGRFVVAGAAPGTPLIAGVAVPGCAPAVGMVRAGAGELVIAAGGGGRLHGVVRDVDGKPAAGATIYVHPADDSYLRQNPDGSFLDGSGLRAAARTVADAAGAYAIRGLAFPQTYRVLVVREDGAQAERGPVALAESDLRLDVDLEAAQGLRVRVCDPGGRRVGAAPLMLYAAGGQWTYGFGIPRATDAAGEAWFPGLAAGEYRVVVRPAGWAPATAPVLVEAGAVAEVDLAVAPGLTLTGRVTDVAGRPLRGLRVSFVWGRESPPCEHATVTGRDGAFRLDGLEAGPGTLHVTDDTGRYLAWTGEAAPPAPASVIVLEAAGRVRGRILPPPPGGTLPYVLLAEEEETTRYYGERCVRLRGDGGFEIGDLPVRAELTLLLRVPDALPLRRELGQLAPGQVRELGVLEAVAGPTLRGRVLDEDDRPVADVRVVLEDEDWSLEARTLSAADGTFSFANVPPGPLALTVWNGVDTGEVSEIDDWAPEAEIVLRVRRGR